MIGFCGVFSGGSKSRDWLTSRAKARHFSGYCSGDSTIRLQRLLRAAFPRKRPSHRTDTGGGVATSHRLERRAGSRHAMRLHRQDRSARAFRPAVSATRRGGGENGPAACHHFQGRQAEAFVPGRIEQGTCPAVDRRDMPILCVSDMYHVAVTRHIVQIARDIRGVPAPRSDEKQRPGGPDVCRQADVCTEKCEHIFSWLDRAEIEQISRRQIELAKHDLYFLIRCWRQTRSNSAVRPRNPLRRNRGMPDHFVSDEVRDDEKMHIRLKQAAKTMFVVRDGAVGAIRDKAVRKDREVS